MIASQYGGVNIEEIAKTNPAAIIKEPVDITKGTEHQLRHECPNTTIYIFLPIQHIQIRQVVLCRARRALKMNMISVEL